jgi:hypothetical protein
VKRGTVMADKVSSKWSTLKKDLSGSRQGVDLAIGLLDEWMADESGYDEETWPELKTALDRDRLSSRRLFDE